MATYISTQFSTAEEFENWIRMNEHANKDFLDNLCEEDKKAWDNKACNIRVKDGKLQLLCANGNVLAEADYYAPDESTVCCDGNGAVKVKGIANANEPDGRNFRLWVGTWAEYNAIRVKDDKTLYLVSDDTTIDEIIYAINEINENFEAFKTALKNGDFVVLKAEIATKDANGNIITNTYVNKSGDTMTGTLTVPSFVVANDSFPSVFLQNTQKKSIGSFRVNTKNGKNRVYIGQRGNDETYTEDYYLPERSSGLSKTKEYDILTSKSPVTIAQGGTGATNASQARINLGTVYCGRHSDKRDVGMGSGENYMWMSFYDTSGSEVETLNYLQLYKTYTAFGKPVDVESGGTGATTAEGARENLGIFLNPKIETGIPTSGYFYLKIVHRRLVDGNLSIDFGIINRILGESITKVVRTSQSVSEDGKYMDTIDYYLDMNSSGLFQVKKIRTSYGMGTSGDGVSYYSEDVTNSCTCYVSKFG